MQPDRDSLILSQPQGGTSEQRERRPTVGVQALAAFSQSDEQQSHSDLSIAS